MGCYRNVAIYFFSLLDAALISAQVAKVIGFYIAGLMLWAVAWYVASTDEDDNNVDMDLFSSNISTSIMDKYEFTIYR
eukprot:UN21655